MQQSGFFNCTLLDRQFTDRRAHHRFYRQCTNNFKSRQGNAHHAQIGFGRMSFIIFRHGLRIRRATRLRFRNRFLRLLTRRVLGFLAWNMN